MKFAANFNLKGHQFFLTHPVQFSTCFVFYFCTVSTADSRLLSSSSALLTTFSCFVIS